MPQEYGQFCPVALASELLAERWTLLVVRELLAGARRFNEIRRGVPRLSATLLKQRLSALEYGGVVERRKGSGAGSEYCLTAAGLALRSVVGSIGEWGQRWARDLKPSDLDPGWLVWGMHRRLNTKAMPPGRTVIAIEFTDVPAAQRRFWLVHTDRNVDVCLKDPGYEVRLAITSRLLVFAEVWRGIRPLRAALADGSVRLSGSAAHRRALASWLLLSTYAAIKRER